MVLRILLEMVVLWIQYFREFVVSHVSKLKKEHRVPHTHTHTHAIPNTNTTATNNLFKKYKSKMKS